MTAFCSNPSGNPDQFLEISRLYFPHSWNPIAARQSWEWSLLIPEKLRTGKNTGNVFRRTDTLQHISSVMKAVVINARIDACEKAKNDADAAIQLYESFTFLYRATNKELNLFDDNGNLRDRQNAEGNIDAGLLLIGEWAIPISQRLLTRFDALCLDWSTFLMRPGRSFPACQTFQLIQTPMEILTGKKQDKEWIDLLFEVIREKEKSFSVSTE